MISFDFPGRRIELKGYELESCGAGGGIRSWLPLNAFRSEVEVNQTEKCFSLANFVLVWVLRIHL